MKVTIKGITPATIAFNTLGIVIRGDSNNKELYPESIARHIDIVNEDQLTEVNSLVNARYISVESEDPEAPKRKEPKPTDLVGSTSVITTVEPQDITEDITEDIAEDVEEDVEDAPSSASEEVEAPKKRGRPKGSKNAKSRKAYIKSDESKKLKSKPDVKRSTTDNPESQPIVMTPSGAKKGKMRRSATGDIADSDATRVSIEAMKKLEEEERIDRNLPDEIIDESQLDPSEQSGLSAVISSHGNAAKVKMKNSLVPEAKQIRERGVEFIDQADKDAEDKAKKAFVDQQERDDDLDFLEY